MKKQKDKIYILGIETSCDETAAAVLQTRCQSTRLGRGWPSRGRTNAHTNLRMSLRGRLGDRSNLLHNFRLKSNIVASSLDLHKKTLGIVPEVAARKQAELLMPVIDKALKKAKLGLPDLDAIAVTIGPGLVGSLLVGVETAKTIAYLLGIPVIPINHIEGHILANFLSLVIARSKATKQSHRGIAAVACGDLAMTRCDEDSSEVNGNAPRRWRRSIFPAVVLTVSGGHTSLILMNDFGKYELLGETIDDAAGEAFDKVAKLLGLGYPGGPAISAAAEKVNRKQETGNRTYANDGNDPPWVNGNAPRRWRRSLRNCSVYKLPRPMLDSGDFNFSFSGIKTSVLYLVRFLQTATPTLSPPPKADRLVRGRLRGGQAAAIAKEFQQAMVDVLVSKTVSAAQKYRAKSVFLSGGVAANKALRNEMRKMINKKLPETYFSVPDFEFCTDNSAMIALAGAIKFNLKKGLKNWYDVSVDLNSRV